MRLASCLVMSIMLFSTAARPEAETELISADVSACSLLEFPPGWQTRKEPVEGVALVAFRPREKADEVVYERIEVALREDDGEDPDAFRETHTAGLKAVLPDFALVGKGVENFPGFSAEYLVYTFTDHFISLEVQAQAKQWIVRRAGRIYLITARTTVDSFPRYEETFRKIVGSFRPAE